MGSQKKRTQLYVRDFIKKAPSFIKDFIIYGVLFALLGWMGYQKLVDSNDLLNDLSNYVGSITIILFGVIGIFEFAYDNGLSILVPSSFASYKKKRITKQMKYYIDRYLKEEQHIISQYNNERISFFLGQLGLTQRDFEIVKDQIVEIKLMPLHNLDEAKAKLRAIIVNGDVIYDQDKHASKTLIYKGVKYFIDLTNIMYVKDYSTELVDCMIMLIKETLKTTLGDITKVIVPCRSNRMLGFGVGEKLGKAIINVTQYERVFHDEFWEGNFADSKRNCGIIIHDVLVTGAQIIETIDKIGSHCDVSHLFCLVNRCGNEDLRKLKDKGINVHALLNLLEDDIANLWEERNAR